MWKHRTITCKRPGGNVQSCVMHGCRHVLRPVFRQCSMRSNEVITKMCLVYIRYIIYHLIQVTFMKLNVFIQGHVAEYVSHWGRHVRPIFTRDSSCKFQYIYCSTGGPYLHNYYHFGINKIVSSPLFLSLAFNKPWAFDPPTSLQRWPACCHGSYSFSLVAGLFP